MKVGIFARARVYDVSDQSLVTDHLTHVPHINNALIENVFHIALTYIAITHCPDSPHDIHLSCSPSQGPIRIQHRYGEKDYQETPIDVLELVGQEGYNRKDLQIKGLRYSHPFDIC
jgi:hypothetical protein